MPKIPESVRREYVSGLPLISRGKVRDTYALPNPALLLSVATDRVSIFDFVLPAEVPQKGEVLAAGAGKLDDDGKRVPMEVKKGDKVLYSKYGGTETKDPDTGEDLLVLRESDVLALIES